MKHIPSDELHQPIGVFDSGLGGLTVLRALQTLLPGEDFLYFADARYLPYGDRSEDFLQTRSRLIVDALAAKGAKALVIACNTATAAAAEVVRSHTRLPVVALEPAVKPAVALSRSGRVGVLATTRTLASRRFKALLERYAGSAEVHAQACPGLAEAIENEGPTSVIVRKLLDRYMAPLATAAVDVVVLGCTHYPWVREEIAARLDPGVELIDTGEAVARQLQRRLPLAKPGDGGNLCLATSGNPISVRETVARLFGALPVEHWNL
jgi:glutamate racemase